MDNSITTLLERLSRVLQNDAHDSGLKPTQWEALRYLARANRFSRSPGALTTYLGMTKGTVSQTLLALGRKGLVDKQATAKDRRGVKLDLTKAGEMLLASDPMLKIEISIAAMPHRASVQLAKFFEGLLKDMISQRGGRPFGVCKTCTHFRSRHLKGAPNYCSLLNERLSEIDSEQICIEQKPAAREGATA